VHGKELMPGKNFLTLQEALAQKKVIVYETKDVNELAIRNLSNQDVYVQSGDVVRGGDQDRMISIDFIVPPRSKRIPIAAFCVESDRWEREERKTTTPSVLLKQYRHERPETRSENARDRNRKFGKP
jgi:phosphoribosylaminoimidazole carboxylase (NCAIR synthetase)